MKMPNGSLIVRFIPVCVPLSNIDETKKAAGTFGLTARQSQVVGWLSQGLSDKQIATEMDCAIHTVRSHLRNIYAALDVNGRVETLNIVRAKSFL